MLKKLYVFALNVGGLILLAHSIDINHLPDVDLASLTLVLLAAAVAGLFTTAVLSTALVVPGLVWNLSIVSRPTYALKPTNDADAHREIFVSFGLPIIPTIIGVLVWMADFKLWLISGSCWFFIGLALSVVWAFGWFLRRGLTFPQALEYLVLWTISWVFFVGSFYVVLQFVNVGLAQSNVGEQWMAFIPLLICVLFCNVLAAVPPHQMPDWIPQKFHRPAWTAMVAIGALAIVTALTDAWSFIPKGVMRVYRLGGDIDVTLVVEKEGCIVARAYGLNPPTKQDGTCRIEGLKLRSRLGTEYLLKTDTKAFTLPAEYVLSRGFPVEEKKKPEQPKS